LAPRALGKIVRPRRLAGVVVRPLNFTVRHHLFYEPPVSIESIRDSGVIALAKDATDFLAVHWWCRSIRSSHLAYANPPVLGVFLFRIVPSTPNYQSVLWVVVGDLPAAYLVCDDAPTWREALRSYADEMGKWVAAVRARTSLMDVIQVGVEPTLENADKVDSRLRVISRIVLKYGK
jgi:hypothetical protein